MQAGLGADVDRDVGVKRQVLPRDDLVLGRVHPVLLPGLTGLGEHVESRKRVGGKGARMGDEGQRKQAFELFKVHHSVNNTISLGSTLYFSCICSLLCVILFYNTITVAVPLWVDVVAFVQLVFDHLVPANG